MRSLYYFPTTLKNHRALCHPTFNKYNTYGSLFINWNHSKPNQHWKTAKIILNPCPAEKIKMPHPLLIFRQSDYLCQIFDANSQTNSADLDQWPTDLDLYHFQMLGITGFSRTRVKTQTWTLFVCIQYVHDICTKFPLVFCCMRIYTNFLSSLPW